MTFSANGAGLIVANASNHIGVYNVETLSASDWTKTQGSHLPSRLLNMPGSIASISMHPQVGLQFCNGAGRQLSFTQFTRLC